MTRNESTNYDGFEPSITARQAVVITVSLIVQRKHHLNDASVNVTYAATINSALVS